MVELLAGRRVRNRAPTGLFLRRGPDNVVLARYLQVRAREEGVRRDGCTVQIGRSCILHVPSLFAGGFDVAPVKEVIGKTD